MAEARAALYAQQTGLTAYLHLISSSLDELEGLAVGQRVPEVSEASEGGATRRETSANSFLDAAASALSAGLLYTSGGASESATPHARPPRGKLARGGGLGEERSGTVPVSGGGGGGGRGPQVVGDATFSTRDAAVKAEVCRTLSDFTADMRDGHLALPAELSWKEAVSGHDWLGVSLAFRTAHSLRDDAARAFANYQSRVADTPSASLPPAGSGSRGGSLSRHARLTASDVAAQRSAFFHALLTPATTSDTAAAGVVSRPSFNAEAEGFARFFLHAHCADFPDTLWHQALTLARTAVHVAAQSEDVPRPLRLDVVVLRCLLLHTAAPTALGLVSTFRNPAVRTLATAAVCQDRGEIPRDVVEEVLQMESLVAMRVAEVRHVDDACAPPSLLVAVVHAKSFWLWASPRYSGAWTQYYMEEQLPL